MNFLDSFISKTLKPFLIIFGLATCVPLLFAIDSKLLPEMFNGIQLSESLTPVVRHWGYMVFGIGAMMIAAAFYPWLRMATMVYSTTEKALMVYLWVSSSNTNYGSAYLGMGILDSIICLYSILFFISSIGRPAKWQKIQ